MEVNIYRETTHFSNGLDIRHAELVLKFMPDVTL